MEEARVSPASPSAGWGALLVEIPAAHEEDLVAILGGGSLGVEVRPAGPDAVRLVVYHPSRELAEQARAAAADRLGELGLEPRTCLLGAGAVPDERWVERYQASLAPLPLGDRFAVVPGEGKAPPPSRIPIRLVPGRAFGTGEHPTTRLCVAALERWVVPGAHWLDLGTGTGLLAAVALLLGADQVDACDDDPEAFEVAREVLAANRLAGRIELRVATASDYPERAFQGVVANIAAPFFLERAAQVERLLLPGGLLLASGLLPDDVDPVSGSLELAGLKVIEQSDEAGWCLITARLETQGDG
jgi:ribosomal protein L11 methyltransferase